MEILEYCEPENVIEREQYYLDTLKPEYNILKIAGSTLGYTHTEETREKLRGENNPMFGITGEKHHRFGKPRAEGAGNGLPPQKVEVLDKKTNLKTYYESIREASRALNIEQYIISRYFSRNQQKPYKNRYIFKKI